MAVAGVGWSKIATSTWGANNSCCTGNGEWNNSHPRLACCSGLDSPKEARFKAQHFDLVYIDSGIGSPGCNFSFLFPPGNDSMADCHRHRSASAARIKQAARALNRTVPVLVYRQISPMLEGVRHDDPALLNHRNRIHHASRFGASGSSQRPTTVTVERAWAGHVVA